MTEKQKIKSLTLKLQRIQKNKPDFDFDKARQNYHDIKRYYDLSQELFWLKFNDEHCQNCGKKY